MAKNVDLKVTETEKACENTPKGSVCAQDPKAKQSVNKGDTITLTVSTGAPKVAVPNVIGDKEDAATTELEGDRYQFDVDTKTKESDEEAGTVLETDPVFGEEVEKGSKITLTIAKKREQSTVPDVVGRTCDEAKAQMEANDLVGVCAEVETEDDNLVGKVISTDPGANSQVAPNSQVNIQIGKEAEDEEQQVQVPSVVGQTLDNARQILEGAGLKVGNVNSQDGNALVFDQDPDPGQQVAEGTAVNLTTAGQNNGGGDNGGGGFLGGANGASARNED